MASYRKVAIAVVWTLSLIAAGVLGVAAERSTDAQTVFSGNDLGFRVEGMRGQARVGTLMVRIDGRWVEVEFSPRVRPASESH